MMRRLSIAAAVTLFACGDGGGFPDARPIDAPAPPGTFTLAWSLTDTSGATITCDQVGAQSVTAIMRNRDVQGGFTEVFTCNTGMGTSQAVAPGTYDIQFELIGTGGDPVTGIVATATAQMGVEIPSGGQVALMPLTFAVEATGGLALTIDAPATGTNCGAVATQGAGITTMTLSLERGGTCQPVTLMIGANRTYTVNCTTPTPTACIETTETITASNLPSGTYTIRIRGNRGAEECFSNNDSLPVPPLGRTLTRTLNLAQATSCP